MLKISQLALLVLVVCNFGAAQGGAKSGLTPCAPAAGTANKKAQLHDRCKPRNALKQPAKNAGKSQTGKASFYSHKLAGKRMASGARMDPGSNNAASRTLPLGTRARVTNMHNGKSAVVVIQDRSPHVKGRIIDLLPATAKAMGVGKQGVVLVEVTPIGAPPSGGKTPDGEGRKRR